MPKLINCHIYEVSRQNKATPGLSQTIDGYAGLALDQRWRSDVRLDRCEKRQIEHAGKQIEYYLLDFAKQRDVGPGKVSQKEPTTGIKMPDDTTFGEETSALYCSNKWFLVLHNHYGIGPTRMMTYFNHYNLGGDIYDYEAIAKLDLETEAKLKNYGGIKTIQVSASRSALEQTGTDDLTSVAKALKSIGTEWMQFELRANQPHKRGKRFDASVIKMVQALLGKNEDEVSKLAVTGFDPVQEKDAVLDLIHHKIRLSYNIKELDVEDKKYTTESRWKLLERSLRNWLKVF